MERRALSFDSLVEDITRANDLESFAAQNLGHIAMETIFNIAKRISMTDPETANALLDTASVQQRVTTPCMRMPDGAFVPLPQIDGHISHQEYRVQRSFIPKAA